MCFFYVLNVLPPHLRLQELRKGGWLPPGPDMWAGGAWGRCGDTTAQAADTYHSPELPGDNLSIWQVYLLQCSTPFVQDILFSPSVWLCAVTWWTPRKSPAPMQLARTSENVSLPHNSIQPGHSLNMFILCKAYEEFALENRDKWKFWLSLLFLKEVPPKELFTYYLDSVVDSASFAIWIFEIYLKQY